MLEIKFEIKIKKKGNDDTQRERYSLDELINKNGVLFNQNLWEVLYKREYIGKKDKKGNEIYNGDIIEYYHDCFDYILQFKTHQQEKIKCIVIYNENTCQYELKCEKNKSDIHSISIGWGQEQLEIIGNIYENLELRDKING